MERVCVQCGIAEPDAYLTRCPTCHKTVCEECRFIKSGHTFCCRGCGEMFFHDDEDESEGAE